MFKLLIIVCFLVFGIFNCSSDNNRVVVRESFELKLALDSINAEITPDSIHVYVGSYIHVEGFNLDSCIDDPNCTAITSHLDTVYKGTTLETLDSLVYTCTPKITETIFVITHVYRDTVLVAEINEVLPKNPVIVISVISTNCIDTIDGQEVVIPCIDKVVDENEAPQALEYPLNVVNVGEEYIFKPKFADPENDSVYIKVDYLPDWLSFDTVNMVISGTPKIEDIGIYRNIVIDFWDKAHKDSTLSIGPFDIFVKINSTTPVVSDIPDQKIAQEEGFQPVDLNIYVHDEGYPDSLIEWSVTGVDGNGLIAVIDPVTNVLNVELNGSWSGSDTLYLTATNPLGNSSSNAIVYTVIENIKNTLRMVKVIEDQVIDVGQSFVDIPLREYGKDDAEKSITWTAHNNEKIQVTFSQEWVASVIPPTPFWVGSELITFKANNGTDTLIQKVNFTVTTPNLARDKEARQSTTDWEGYASKAVDGDISGDKYSVTSTTEGPAMGKGSLNPWWEVDLGKEVFVSGFKIYNRTDGYWDRLKDFTVYLSKFPIISDDPEVARIGDDVSSVIQLDPFKDSLYITANRILRYIRIQFNKTGILSLAEVKVFSKKDMQLAIHNALKENPKIPYIISTDNSAGGSARAVGVGRYSDEPGEVIRSWSMWGGETQRWYLEQDSVGNRYVIRSVATNRCIQVDTLSWNLTEQNCHWGKPEGMFDVIHDPINGTYMLKSVLAGVDRYLTLDTLDYTSGESGNNGAVKVLPFDPNSEMQRILVKLAPFRQY